jgi:hypothetical protein
MTFFQALCNAVEHEKFEKAKSILEQHPDLRLDGINSDGFTPLDLVRGNQSGSFFKLPPYIYTFIYIYPCQILSYNP